MNEVKSGEVSLAEIGFSDKRHFDLSYKKTSISQMFHILAS